MKKALLRYCTAILFLLSFVLQVFQAHLITLAYYVDSTSFAKNCINKARPQLHCNGKCALAKKIKEEEKKEQENP